MVVLMLGRVHSSVDGFVNGVNLSSGGGGGSTTTFVDHAAAGHTPMCMNVNPLPMLLLLSPRQFVFVKVNSSHIFFPFLNMLAATRSWVKRRETANAP